MIILTESDIGKASPRVESDDGRIVDRRSSSYGDSSEDEDGEFAEQDAASSNVTLVRMLDNGYEFKQQCQGLPNRDPSSTRGDDDSSAPSSEEEDSISSDSSEVVLDDEAILIPRAHHRRRRLRFGFVNVIELTMTMGDHPECKKGPPVCLSSHVQSQRVYEIDAYEAAKKTRRTRTRRQMYLSVEARKRIVNRAVEDALSCCRPSQKFRPPPSSLPKYEESDHSDDEDFLNEERWSVSPTSPITRKSAIDLQSILDLTPLRQHRSIQKPTRRRSAPTISLSANIPDPPPMSSEDDIALVEENQKIRVVLDDATIRLDCPDVVGAPLNNMNAASWRQRRGRLPIIEPREARRARLSYKQAAMNAEVDKLLQKVDARNQRFDELMARMWALDEKTKARRTLSRERRLTSQSDTTISR